MAQTNPDMGRGDRAGRLTGAENLLLHFTPFAEDRSKLPVIVSGEGCHVTDDGGRKYIDGLAGMFTNQVGNGRDELGEVAARQMQELAFFPNWSFQHPRSLELAAKLARIAPGDLSSTFFVSSGSEAVETVIKLARQYHKANGEPGRYKILSRSLAYHGTTMGALSATGLPTSRRRSSPCWRAFTTCRTRSRTPRGRPTPSRRL
jgi:adenosylmethionine-8-amino-7-oxononanoate aminotransferase